MAPDFSSHVDESAPQLPDIAHDDPFVKVVKTLSFYVVDAITLPRTFEQLRTTSGGTKIQLLVQHLVANVTNPAIVNAILTLKWHFSSLEPDDRGLNETRANACEIIAWRFLSRLSERDAIDFALYELPSLDDSHTSTPQNEQDTAATAEVDATERTSLLRRSTTRSSGHSKTTPPLRTTKKDLVRSMTQIGRQIITEDPLEDEDEEDPTSSFTGMNALEIAAVADAKRFLSQPVVQKIVYAIWTGEITFWSSLSVHTVKKPQLYNPRKMDPFTRLRVPRYVKAYEVVFFGVFLALYYAVAVERNPERFTPLELFLYIWIAGFAYDEITEFIDAGSMFYATDFWNLWDVTIIIIGIAFFITRMVGLIKGSDEIIDQAFDVLSLEALFLVPRIFSLLSLQPYFGTLIPCLKQMSKDFIKFMGVVFILYLGFLTTFTVLARDHFTLSQMSWILVKVFFGSSYLGFDIMYTISPIFGPPLMIIFVCMTNILLITSLVSILSASWSKINAQAREEYLFVYSVYVLENLLSLALTRPLRVFFTSEQLRHSRIILLKTTHAPIIAIIALYEYLSRHLGVERRMSFVAPHADPSNGSKRPFLTARSSRSSTVALANAALAPAATAPAALGDAPSRSSSSRALATFRILRRDREPPPPTVEVAEAARHAETTTLSQQVADLSAKIEQLTALISAQQGGSPPKSP